LSKKGFFAQKTALHAGYYPVRSQYIACKTQGCVACNEKYTKHKAMQIKSIAVSAKYIRDNDS
jgi:hypothetical protein